MAADPLLLDLYACVGEPDRWPRVLDGLCAQTGAHSVVVQTFKADGARLRTCWSVQDSRTRGAEALHRSVVSDERNPRLDARRALRGLNRIARDEDLFEREDGQRHQLKELLTQMGLGLFIGSLRPLGADTYLGVALHRAAADPGDFTVAQVHRLSALLPHLGQVIELGGRLQEATDFGARLGQYFDRLRCGVLVCGADARVGWMNRSAEALLRQGQALRLHAGSLLAPTPTATRSLHQGIGDVASAGGSGDGRYLSLACRDQALHVAIQPLAATDACARGKASVLVLLTGASIGEIPALALMSLFDLTRAESLLVQALVAGRTLEQYAQQRSVTVGTVRWQLKQVQAKTGVSRQADLVRLVLSSAAAQIAAPDSLERH